MNTSRIRYIASSIDYNVRSGDYSIDSEDIAALVAVTEAAVEYVTAIEELSAYADLPADQRREDLFQGRVTEIKARYAALKALVEDQE